MDKILFKAQKLGTKEWVKGSLLEHEAPLQCLGSEQKESDYFILKTGFADWNMTRPIEQYQVDPKTIGQYIGFVDKNKNRIFTGDKVYYCNKIGIITMYQGCYIIKIEGRKITPSYLNCELLEIIGNIND